MMELLSPAGSREALIAAVQNGADAVYFGGSMFNARRFAANFDDHGLISAIDYCHERGGKVNITLNTLLLDKEIFLINNTSGKVVNFYNTWMKQLDKIKKIDNDK